MSKRVRLTKRNAADMSIPYPGNVNQPDRTDPDHAEYHTFEHQVNHELPDRRHEWKDNPRDEQNIGIPDERVFPFGGRVAGRPTMASIRVAASKAVRLATLLLGEKVDEDVIEAQANDFMGMGMEALDHSLNRFAETQDLYASEDEEAEEAEEADAVVGEDGAEAVIDASEDGETTEESTEACGDKSANQVENPVGPNDQNDRAMENWPAEAQAMIASLNDRLAKLENRKNASDDGEAETESTDEVTEETTASEEEGTEEDAAEVEASDALDIGPVEETPEIELSGPIDEDLEPDAIADEQLESLFDEELDEAEEELDEPVEASSRKAGIKKLGGQPRVASASAGGRVDLSSLWDSAPDVRDVFA